MWARIVELNCDVPMYFWTSQSLVMGTTSNSILWTAPNNVDNYQMWIKYSCGRWIIGTMSNWRWCFALCFKHIFHPWVSRITLLCLAFVFPFVVLIGSLKIKRLSRTIKLFQLLRRAFQWFCEMSTTVTCRHGFGGVQKVTPIDQSNYKAWECTCISFWSNAIKDFE